MRLKIDHVGKIEHGDFEFRGMTVIAGNNNTGKSTVGKTLFSVFNSLYGLTGKIEDERLKEKREAFSHAIGHIEFNTESGRKLTAIPLGRWFNWGQNIDLANQDSFRKEFTQKLMELLQMPGVSTDAPEQVVSDVWHEISQVDDVPESDIISILIERTFLPVFKDQVNSLLSNEPAEIELTIKDKKIRIGFDKNQCTNQEVPLVLLNKSLLIQTPESIKALNYRPAYMGAHSTPEDYLCKFLREGAKQSAVAEALTRKKLTRVNALLDEVIPGEILSNERGGFSYQEKGYSEELVVDNLSTGLKSFALLSLLLSRGALSEKDVLILDEPEVHLHPEWQLKYAELVVLLEKIFDLTVLLTTHSPYFLRAIEMYSRKYGMEELCDYYLASLNDRGYAEFNHVNDRLESIYSEMAKPFSILNQMDDNIGSDNHE